MTIYTATSTPRGMSDQVLPALGLAAAIVAVEYLARHFALFWLPVLGSRRVNDMLVTGVCYAGLVWLTIPPWQRHLAALSRATRAILANVRHWQVWLAALAALVVSLLLANLDQFLWGSVRLPFAISPWRWDTTLLAGMGPLLVPASLLLVNGVVIPFAEEWLWRGLIQPRLVGALGFVAGILLTSALFSLKHAIIDASLGRLLAITGFGFVLGLLAARRSWRASALAHALANTTATLLALVGGAVQV